MRATGARQEDALQLTTAFAHDLTAAIYREEPGPARQGVAAVLERYGTSLRLSRDVLAAIADEAVAATRETFAAAGVALDGLRLARQVASAMAERPRPAAAAGPDASAPALEVPKAVVDEGGTVDAVPAAVAGGTAAAVPTAPAPSAAGPVSATPNASLTPVAGVTPVGSIRAVAADGPPVSGPPLASLRDRLARELDAACADGETYDVHRMLLLTLEAALRGGPFDRACFCPIDVASGAFRARFGLGDDVDAAAAALRAAVRGRGHRADAAPRRGGVPRAERAPGARGRAAPARLGCGERGVAAGRARRHDHRRDLPGPPRVRRRSGRDDAGVRAPPGRGGGRRALAAPRGRGAQHGPRPRRTLPPPSRQRRRSRRRPTERASPPRTRAPWSCACCAASRWTRSPPPPASHPTHWRAGGRRSWTGRWRGWGSESDQR